MLSWLLHVCHCPLAVTGYWAGGTFDLTQFVCFSVTVDYSDSELMRMGILVGRAERRSRCAERRIQVVNVVAPGREGHFMESWETLSTGIVKVVWNPVVCNVRVTGLAVCYSSLLIRAAPWKEQGEGCRCRRTSSLLVTLQGCGVEEEGSWEGQTLIKQAQRGAGWVLGERAYWFCRMKLKKFAFIIQQKQRLRGDMIRVYKYISW